jgi:ATP-dependent Clp protease ATP-binding subunit ClpC
MYERFTDRARKVMRLAQLEAQRFNHEYIGTEHILLGLVKEGSGVAAVVLKDLNIDLRRIRLEVEKTVRSAPDFVPRLPLSQTPHAKRAMEYSLEETRKLRHHYIGTEHLLLGLLREQEGMAVQVLMNLGLKPEDVRQEVLSLWGAGLQWGREAEAKKAEAELGELPADVVQVIKELDVEIERFTEEKEGAVAEHDFEKAAHLRDQADRLKKRRESIIREWRRKT